jgi:hypothetical protein
MAITVLPVFEVRIFDRAFANLQFKLNALSAEAQLGE